MIIREATAEDVAGIVKIQVADAPETRAFWPRDAGGPAAVIDWYPALVDALIKDPTRRLTVALDDTRISVKRGRAVLAEPPPMLGFLLVEHRPRVDDAIYWAATRDFDDTRKEFRSAFAWLLDEWFQDATVRFVTCRGAYPLSGHASSIEFLIDMEDANGVKPDITTRPGWLVYEIPPAKGREGILGVRARG